jgi:hypothetical protein
MKRTSLVLEDGIMRGIKREAVARGSDMSKVVNEFLREGLSRRQQKQSPTVKLPAYAMGEVRVNLADRDALEDLMEQR